MGHNRLHEAAALLARHYGSHGAAPAVDWPTLVRIVLEQGRFPKKNRNWSWLDESSLRTAHEASTGTAAQIADELEANDQPASKSNVLCDLAGWWQRRIGAADALAAFRGRSLEHWQSELRAIRGVNWDLADRILLLVGGCDVYPLDRASMRIAQRHGWMDAAAEYDDWQAFFASAKREDAVDLAQLWRWNVQVGREFCGRKPDCEKCPLKALLPAGGPLSCDGGE